MCGRFLLFNEAEDMEIRSIVEEINQKYGSGAAFKTGEILPADVVPSITSVGNTKEASLMKWGFPGFKGKGCIINARSETLDEKPMFRESFHTKRCLIPAHGFYEYKQLEKCKQKYLICSSEKKLFYIAGIYSRFGSLNGEPFDRFVIITTCASEVMSDIHPRMPVIFTTEEESNMWLDSSITENRILKTLLRPYSDIEAKSAVV